MFKRIAVEQEGVSIVIVALVLVILLGFSALVVDAGMLHETRRQLQNGVDAAALAAAQQIAVDKSKGSYSEAQAKAQAYSYADKNGVIAPEVTEVAIRSIYNDNDAVKVSARREVKLLFAPVLGIATGDVGATATAIVTQIEYDNIWPWGITEFDLEPAGEVITLKVAAGGPGNQPAPGNFMALGFSPGAKDYENYIKYGYNGYVPSGVSESNPWMVPSETGNVVGPTVKGVEYLQDLAETTPYGTYDLRNPLIGLIPILDNDAWGDAQGKKPVPVIGFAIFYLYGFGDGPPGQAEVKGTFVDMAYGVGGSQNIGGDLTGIIGARLWE